MDNSRVLEILNILRSKFMVIINSYHMSGICNEINKLHDGKGLITLEEKVFMATLLYDNKPDEHQFTEFTLEEDWKGHSFWWTPVDRDPSTASVRIRYLTALINKLNGEQ